MFNLVFEKSITIDEYKKAFMNGELQNKAIVHSSGVTLGDSNTVFGSCNCCKDDILDGEFYIFKVVKI